MAWGFVAFYLQLSNVNTRKTYVLKPYLHLVLDRFLRVCVNAKGSKEGVKLMANFLSRNWLLPHFYTMIE